MSKKRKRVVSDHHPSRHRAVSDTHRTDAQAPVRSGIDSQVTGSMPRAEDDAITNAGNRDVHDRPGSGTDTPHRLRHY